MLKHIPSLQRLIRQLQHVPYLASKNLYRVAAHFLSADKREVEQLCKAILEAKNNINMCSICCNWTEHEDVCNICSMQRRDKSYICVVETWHDLLAIEKAEDYNGFYHVLGGALSPLDGIGPDNLSIAKLLHRVEAGGVKELIFATNPTPEGEATACFIASRLEGRDIEISRLASGIPIGSSIEYMDRVTIHKALSGRLPF